MKKKDGKGKPPPRRVRVPTSAEAFVEMDDAIVDRRLVTPIGGGVAFLRGGGIHRGWIHSATDTPRGVIVDVWDEAEDQFFSFNLNEDPIPEVKDTRDRHRVKTQQIGVGSPQHGTQEKEEVAAAPEPGAGGVDAPSCGDDDGDGV